MADTPPSGIKPGAASIGETEKSPQPQSPDPRPTDLRAAGMTSAGTGASTYATADPARPPDFDPAQAALRSSGVLGQPLLRSDLPEAVPVFVSDLPSDDLSGSFRTAFDRGTVTYLARPEEVKPPKKTGETQKWTLSVDDRGRFTATISDYPDDIKHDGMVPLHSARIVATGRIWRNEANEIVINGHSNGFRSGDNFAVKHPDTGHEVAETVGLIPAKAVLEELLRQQVHLDPLWDLTKGEAVDEETITQNRLNPKRLDGLTMPDGSVIRVLRELADFPDDPEVHRRWDRHYAVFEISNPELGFVGYVAIHRLTQIESKSPLLHGQWYATGGTRMPGYRTALATLMDSMELAQEMSFKSAGQGLRITGSKCAVYVPGIDPRPDGPDGEARKKVLASFMTAVEKIGRLIGGGVLTGQDMNISVADAQWMFRNAPHSIIPYIAGDLSRPPVEATVVGLLAAMGAAIAKKFPDSPTFRDKVIAIQGVGNIGGLILKPLLEAGAKIIASDVNPVKIAELSADAELQKYVDAGRLRFIVEQKISDREFTGHIYDPLTAFPGLKSEMGVDHVDVFAPCAKGGTLNDTTIPILHSAGVRVVCGSANDASADKNRHPKMLRDHDMIYVPDYIANAGGLLGVDGHLGHEITDEAIDQRVRHRVRDLLDQAEREGLTPQEVADRENRAFFEALPHAPLPDAPARKEPQSTGHGEPFDKLRTGPVESMDRGPIDMVRQAHHVQSGAPDDGSDLTHGPKAFGGLVAGNLAVSVIPATNEELGRESSPSIREQSSTRKMSMVPDTGSPPEEVTRGGDDILRTRLLTLALSRGLDDVATLLSRLSENQIVGLVRAATSWTTILQRSGFDETLQTLRTAPPKSASDKFLLAVAALARSRRDVDRIVSRSAQTQTGASSIPPAFLPPAGAAGLAIGRPLAILR